MRVGLGGRLIFVTEADPKATTRLISDLLNQRLYPHLRNLDLNIMLKRLDIHADN